jgi:hypothetical protein
MTESTPPTTAAAEHEGPQGCEPHGHINCTECYEKERLLRQVRRAEVAEEKLRAAESLATTQLTELQGLYAAFYGSGHSPKNPREAAQAIGQMHDAEAELVTVTAEACRMHYLGNLIRIRSQEEQDELTRLMRKYPPRVLPTDPAETVGIAGAWKALAHANGVAFRDAHDQLERTETELAAERTRSVSQLEALQAHVARVEVELTTERGIVDEYIELTKGLKARLENAERALVAWKSRATDALESLQQTRWNPSGDLAEWAKTRDALNCNLVKTAMDALRDGSLAELRTLLGGPPISEAEASSKMEQPVPSPAQSEQVASPPVDPKTLCVCGHTRAQHSPEKGLCLRNSCGACETFTSAQPEHHRLRCDDCRAHLSLRPYVKLDEVSRIVDRRIAELAVTRAELVKVFRELGGWGTLGEGLAETLEANGWDLEATEARKP